MPIPFRIRLISAILSTGLSIAAFCTILAVYEATVGEVNRLAPSHQKSIMEIRLFPAGLMEKLAKVSQRQLEGMNLFSPPPVLVDGPEDFLTAVPLIIHPDDVDHIRGLSSVKSLAWQWYFQDPLVVSENLFFIAGVPLQYFDFAGLRLSEGRIPAPEECVNCLILGHGARHVLFGKDLAVEQQVQSQIAWKEPFVVAGVLEPSPYVIADLNVFFDSKIYLLFPDTTQAIQAASARGGSLDTIWVQPQYGQEEKAVEDITSWFVEKYGDKVYVQFISRQEYAVLASGINLQRFFLSRFLWTILLVFAVAVINVSSTAFQLLSQQSVSIGIRRSIGASTFMLTMEFLRHVTTYALGGALFGLAIATPLSIFLGENFQFCGVYDCPPIPVRPTWLTFGVGFVVSISLWWLSALLAIYLFMRQSPAELLRTGGADTSGERFKRLLTRLSFAVGILALLIILGLRDGAQAQLDRILGWAGGERAGAFVSWPTRYNQPDGQPQFLKVEHYLLLKKKLPDIQFGWLSVKGMAATKLLSASASMSELRQPVMLAGRWFTSEEEEQKERVTVLGSELARQIADSRGVSPNALIGQEWHEYTIIGVMDTWQASYAMGYYDDAAYILPGLPFSESYEHDPSGQIPFIVPENVDFQATIESMRQILSGLQTRTTKNNMEQSPQYILPTSEVGDVLAWRARLYRMLGLFAGVSLFISATGVMNYLFAWVVSRWREIGIRRALGATQVEIARIVLTQALRLTLFAALAGGTLGTLVALVIQYVSGWPLTLYLSWLAIALGVAALSALVFGGLPAWWAASRAPTEMLRME